MVGKRIALICIVLIGGVTMAFKVNFKSKKEIISKASEDNAPIVVLELFTSQGCSSCPPADVLLQQAKDDYGSLVYALSYHVDYWNYIGWKDPFSNPEYAEKQRKYNIKFKNKSNYTPQVVVNGKAHFVGSSSFKMKAAIAQYGAIKAENKITLSNVKVEKESVSFNYKLNGAIANKSLRAVLVLDKRTTVVKRGENRNKTLANNNIVVAEKRIIIEDLEGISSMKIPTAVEKDEKLNLIVLMVNGVYDITAASKTELLR
ncbi:DUF1223 domain-containing protein [Zobellia barbeyronii]|uniref:DUF1223 domain-containing protein n=1 Tax=Zobellia barbeyronii TaxID=2748009 RepID=A0ABS5WIK3_9FLAO|nr:DUF1223 domain-containing protein [Zobellia barbeyronii]MBT2163236.1 DUF1223 domain-containing protein [Zobellia barbeyronii]